MEGKTMRSETGSQARRQSNSDEGARAARADEARCFPPEVGLIRSRAGGEVRKEREEDG